MVNIFELKRERLWMKLIATSHGLRLNLQQNGKSNHGPFLLEKFTDDVIAETAGKAFYRLIKLTKPKTIRLTDHLTVELVLTEHKQTPTTLRFDVDSAQTLDLSLRPEEYQELCEVLYGYYFGLYVIDDPSRNGFTFVFATSCLRGLTMELWGLDVHLFLTVNVEEALAIFNAIGKLKKDDPIEVMVDGTLLKFTSTGQTTKSNMTPDRITFVNPSTGAPIASMDFRAVELGRVFTCLYAYK